MTIEANKTTNPAWPSEPRELLKIMLTEWVPDFEPPDGKTTDQVMDELLQTPHIREWLERMVKVRKRRGTARNSP